MWLLKSLMSYLLSLPFFSDLFFSTWKLGEYSFSFNMLSFYKLCMDFLLSSLSCLTLFSLTLFNLSLTRKILAHFFLMIISFSHHFLFSWCFCYTDILILLLSPIYPKVLVILYISLNHNSFQQSSVIGYSLASCSTVVIVRAGIVRMS